MKKSDLTLIVGVLAVAGALMGYLALTRTGPVGAVRVTVAGVERLNVPLSNPGTYEVLGEADYRNVVEVTAQGARMVEANCRDHICLAQGSITGRNQSIVCLPHKLVVELVGGKEQGLDEPDVVIR